MLVAAQCDRVVQLLLPLLLDVVHLLPDDCTFNESPQTAPVACIVLVGYIQIVQDCAEDVDMRNWDSDAPPRQDFLRKRDDQRSSLLILQAG